jgi:hypothetical protein
MKTCMVSAVLALSLPVTLPALDPVLPHSAIPEPGPVTPAPLYRDPVFDGAADPVLVWNPKRRAWWMCYTQRRAKLNLPGVAWAHGTEIGVAESRDAGMTWSYIGQIPLTWDSNGSLSTWLCSLNQQSRSRRRGCPMGRSWAMAMWAWCWPGRPKRNGFIWARTTFGGETLPMRAS